MEILEEFLAGSNDNSIVKGKRTKRHGPSSPTLTSSGDGGGEFHSLVSSATTSSTGIATSIDEEDENMANCLILLAQGGVLLPKDEPKDHGLCVYECKTCNRSFSSFQALGGHRASHKKLKQIENIDRKETPATASSGDRQEEEQGQSHKSLRCYDHSKTKIHECSICGAEFSSGQALGGHMRRHRNPNNCTRSVNESSSDGAEKPRNVLALDLNLPAPAEEDNQLPESGPETKFPFSPNHQGMVFSAVALVDCHY